MSEETAVGAVDVALGHADVGDGQDLATMAERTLEGVEPVAIVYRENAGTLDDPADEWQRYDTVADLLDRTVDG